MRVQVQGHAVENVNYEGLPDESLPRLPEHKPAERSEAGASVARMPPDPTDDSGGLPYGFVWNRNLLLPAARTRHGLYVDAGESRCPLAHPPRASDDRLTCAGSSCRTRMVNPTHVYSFMYDEEARCLRIIAGRFLLGYDVGNRVARYGPNLGRQTSPTRHEAEFSGDRRR